MTMQRPMFPEPISPDHAPSRRATLRLVSSAAAIAVPAMAMPGEHADTELLALGQQLEAQWPITHQTENLAREISDRVHAVALASVKLPDDQDTWTKDDATAFWNALKAASVGTGWNDAGDRATLEWNRLDKLAAAIMAAPASTVAGLGVKARAAMFVYAELWHDDCARAPVDPETLDYQERVTRQFIEQACSAAGLPATPLCG